MDQQIAALDNLQAALDAAPQMRMPCPRAAAAAQANMPDVMSYLASSRFGPAFFDALAQQVCAALSTLCPICSTSHSLIYAAMSMSDLRVIRTLHPISTSNFLI